MASQSDMVEIIPMVTETVSSTQTPIHGYTFETEEGAAVNMADLKPIIMMSNMATVSEEVQVSTQVPMNQEPIEMNYSEGVLRSHLMANNNPTSARKHVTSEVYPDNETGVTYEIVRGGTSRGRDKLIDSLGFTYNMKQGRGNKNLTYWWCAIRNTHLRCPASVVQRGNVFIRGKRKHEHLVGQSTPKPSISGAIKRTPVGRPPGSSKLALQPVKKSTTSTPNYRVIKEGSKAGKDLLKDRFGYTYTQKKLCKDGRSYWICSIRNKHLRCPAMVIQMGDTFAEGSQSHKHMPHSKYPAQPHEVLPKMSDVVGDMNDDFDDYSDDMDEGGTSRSYNKSSYSGYGNSPAKKVSRQQRVFAKESKRKDHPTFLGPSCTINLTKCDDSDCNCKMVHCPFCDPSHFIPAKAGRVQDHLELTHFAHGVQYDDLMIVKCFQDCNLERNFGHYHCVFCCQQILKRNSYARHMMRHMRKLGIPDRLLVLPDSKFPDVINAYGYEIPICKKVTCQPNREKHYHCPQCQQVCKERSLTVNHLWRCLQRKSEVVEHNSDDDEMLNTVDEKQLNLHFSHVKSFKDLPLEKCSLHACCNGMYHCRLCPPSLFRPSYRQHLIAHYVTHWKQRVPYKGYSLLKCFQTCEGIDRRCFKTKFHFHCPICCKIILTKGSFEEHIRGCHMFKFGENLIEDTSQDMDASLDGDVCLVQELAPLHDNVDYMEEKLISQAIAYDEQKQLAKKARIPLSKKRTYQHGGRFRGLGKRDDDFNRLVKRIKQEINDVLEQEEINQYVDGNDDDEAAVDFTEDIFGLDVANNEIFDLGSVIFSEKFIEALKSTTVVNSVLSKMAAMTNTKVSEEDGRYLLSGKIDDIVMVKELIAKIINGVDESDSSGSEEQEDSSPVKKSAKKKSKATSEESEGDSVKNTTPKSRKKAKGGKTTGNKGKKVVEPVKKGRGRPKKVDDDSFPYSEIKEIIAASKKTDEGAKRGRGRPAKKLPAPTKLSVKKSGKKAVKKEPPRTPSRYGTRGVKRNYLEMSSGNTRIKQEVVSDNEEEDDDDNEEKEIESSVEEYQEMSMGEEEGEDADNSKTENDKAGYLDDSEQEELDKDSENDEGDGDVEDDGSANIFLSKPNKRITENSVKKLKTSYVSTSVPLISKVGIRKVNCGKRKMKKEVEDELEMDKVVKTVNEDSLKCSLCDDYTAASFSDMTKHLMTLHHVYEPPRCDVCELDTDTYQSLTLHIDRKHGPKNAGTFYCSVGDCKKVFSLETSLRSHVSTVHKSMKNSSKEKKHFCDKCQYKSNSIEDLYEHKKDAHEEEICCSYCQKNFVSYQTLKSHIDLKHSDAVPQKCNICSKEFSSEAYLQRHMKFHNRLFACELCGKAISTKASLDAHMETHKPEEERNYKFVCSYCGKKFFLKNNYDDHLNKHTGNRPYSCDMCNKKFGFRSMLKKHKTFVHTEERPFKCGYCMKGFKFMNLLKNHVTIHTHQSKYVCQCGKSFSTAQTLKFHKQKCRVFTEFTKIEPQNSLLSKTDNVMTVEIEPTNDIQNVVVGDIVGNTTMPSEQEVVMNTEIDQSGATLAFNITNPVPDEIVEQPVTAPPAAGTTVEVYACSECRATFRAFKDAELHVLTAHTQA